ncbi:uncharacterized protein LOC135477144 [Liolophura sinensis]|uniref:uncharacterized protein LOC135477144 n=1 Tax=Liolophura sinensis TaxID=3198878 RepID=UPI003158BDEE
MVKTVDAVGQSIGLCSDQNRVSNLQACLNAIGNAALDTSQFWFGTDYNQRCPQGPFTQGFGCFLPQGFQIPESMSSLVFTPGTFDPVTLDRYLHVTFTSPEGQYYACGNDFEFEETISFTLDPLSSAKHLCWDAREMPEMTWQSSPGELFSLLVYDVPYGFIHGVYVNIPGNDFTRSEVVDPYHGPKNPNRFGNPYVFLLYTQQQRITVDPKFSERIPGQPFNVSEFAEIHSLSGPVAMNWLLAEGDAYAVEQQKSWGVVNNCPMIVSDEKVEIKRTVREDGKVSNAFLFANVSANPLGDGYIRAALARDEPHAELTIARLSFIPVDDSGKLYTLIMVDPDTASSTVGTGARPLLHWLMINVPYDDVNKGNNVMRYIGPAPPDQVPHFYYFLLYEQTAPLTEEAHRPYAGQSCSEALLYSKPFCPLNRCLFDVNGFTIDNSLKLVGASWFVSRRDEYVRYARVQLGFPEDEECRDVAGYNDPCMAVAGSSRHHPSILACITSAGAVVFLLLLKDVYL